MENLTLETVVQQLSGVLSAYGLKVIGAIVGLIVGRAIRGLVAASDGSRHEARRRRREPHPVRCRHGLRAGHGVRDRGRARTVRYTDRLVHSRCSARRVSQSGWPSSGTLSNFAAGVMLLLFRPFRVGDLRPRWRARSAWSSRSESSRPSIDTLEQHPTDSVDDFTVHGDKISNYTANDTRRVDLHGRRRLHRRPATIGEEGDQPHPRQPHDKVLDRTPPPQVEVVEMGDSSVNLVVRPWCDTDDYWRVYFDVTQSCKEQLEAADCSIPFLQRDVHLLQTAGGSSGDGTGGCSRRAVWTAVGPKSTAGVARLRYRQRHPPERRRRVANARPRKVLARFEYPCQVDLSRLCARKPHGHGRRTARSPDRPNVHASTAAASWSTIQYCSTRRSYSFRFTPRSRPVEGERISITRSALRIHGSARMPLRPFETKTRSG